jgi:hypothetical protein
LGFLFAYALTLCSETLVLFLILRKKRYSTLSIVLNSAIPITLTLPFVWFFFPKFGLGWAADTAIAEICVFMVKVAYYKKTFANLRWKEALLASFVCNLVSFGLGLLLL